MSYQQLPVSADHVDQSTFDWGLPYQISQVPNIQVPPPVAQFLPLIVGHFRSELQNNVQKGPARVFLYNMLAQNNFNNQMFEQFVNSLAEYVLMGLMTDQQAQQNPEPLIAHVAKDFCTMMAAFMVHQYPVLEQRLSPQAKGEVQNQLQRLGQMQQQVSQMMSQMQGGAPMGGQQMGWNQQATPGNLRQQQGGGTQWGTSQPQNMGWNQPMGGQGQWGPQQPNQGMGWGNQPAQNQWSGMYGGGQAAPQRPMPQGQDMFGQIQSQGYGQQTPSGGSRFGTSLKPRSHAQQGQREEPQPTPTGPQDPGYVMEAFGPGDTGYHDNRTAKQQAADQEKVRAQQDQGGWARHREPVQATNPEPSATPWRGRTLKERFTPPTQAPAPEAEPMPEQNDDLIIVNPERPFDHFYKDGLEFRPAFLAVEDEWEKTWSIDKPYKVAYDPNKDILFYVRDAKGTVTEVLQPLGEGMDYLQHELNDQLKKARTKYDEEHGPRIEPNWEIVETMKPVVEPAEGEPQETDILEGKKPLVLPDLLVAHTFDQAKLLHEIRMMERGVTEKHLDIPKEYYYRQATPIKLHGEQIAEVRSELQKLSESLTVKDLVKQLVMLYPTLDNDVWHLIHDRLTDHVNEILARNFQMVGWALESIVDDFGELGDIWLKEFGEKEGAALYQSLNLMGIEPLAKASCGMLTDEELLEYLGGLTERPGVDKDALQKSMVVLADPTSVTHVPWNISETSVMLDPEGSAIRSSQFPELYKAIKAIFDRTDAISLTFRRHYLETRDGSLYELYRGYLGKDYYLMRQVH